MTQERQIVQSTTLFQDRAGFYTSYRPEYPRAAHDILNRFVPTPADVADVAAGTGILSRSLASRGYRTIAVEPNPAMRDEIRATDTTGELRTVNGTGEATGLPDNSVDLVTVAQAFHWLNPDTALNEFRRIGRTGALAAVVWNTRQFHATPFMRDYRALLDEHAPEYARMKMNWANLYDRVKTFFPGWTIESVIDNPQRWTRDELLGNL